MDPQSRDGRFVDYPNSNSSTSSWSYDNHAPPPPPLHDGGSINYGDGFSNNGNYNHHHLGFNQHHGQQQHSFGNQHQPNDFGGHVNDNVSSNSLPFPGRKRQFFHGTPPEYIGGGSFVKLYVRGVPREVTEQEIRNVFDKHGNIVEVVLFKDRRSQLQGICFVKYAKIEEADQAIRALHNQHMFPGEMHPIEVKYASGEQERLGNPLGVLGAHQLKVFVCFLNKQASKEEIAEIFSPYGSIQEVFLLRDENKQNRGMGFISFSDRDMAAAAIHALDGKYLMKGCERPLLVRFADPKKPKTGEHRPAPYIGDQVGQLLKPNALRTPSQTGSEHPSVSSNSAVPINTEMADQLDCDWSEHICPDGYTYYYNCVTCESRWEKPEEYSFYEQNLENWHRQPNTSWRHPDSLVHSTQPVSQVQQVQLQT